MSVGYACAIALEGLTGLLVTVECDLGRGLPGISVVGRGDTAVVQARDRIRAAMSNCGLAWPKQKVVMSLSPADVPKTGAGFDLAMVCAILAAQGLPYAGRQRVQNTIMVGELGLDGRLRPVPGVVPIIVAAAQQGFAAVIIPRDCAEEAAQVVAQLPGVDVWCAADVGEVAAWIGSGGGLVLAADVASSMPPQQLQRSDSCDMADVVGQDAAKRALEVAAAGGHALFLVGPPGTGKSMLARRLSSILPQMSAGERLEAAAVHSIAGQKGDCARIWRGERPYVAPHHSVTVAALVGGGNPPLPGAVSLAHQGILFLDEVTETRAGVVDALRIPLENRSVELTRANRSYIFPAQTQLVLAANPCPCGAAELSQCRCSSRARQKFFSRLSGPIRDRIDLYARTVINSRSTLVAGGGAAESSAQIRERVEQAARRSHERWHKTLGRVPMTAGFTQQWAQGIGGSTGVITNATVPSHVLRRQCAATDEAMVVLQELLRAGELSQRGVDKALRVAWTLTDLAGGDRPGLAEVLDAVELYSDDAVGAVPYSTPPVPHGRGGQGSRRGEPRLMQRTRAS